MKRNRASDFKVKDNFPCLAFVSWDRPKLPFCVGKQYGQDAVISKANPAPFPLHSDKNATFTAPVGARLFVSNADEQSKLD